MQPLPRFLLDEWLARGEDPAIRWDLASSTGLTWTIASLEAALGGALAEATRLTPLTYSTAEGHERLRQTIALFHGARPADVIAVTGASEALHVVFAALPPAGNVVLPSPAFPPIVELPRALGLDIRLYDLRAADAFRLDVDRILAMCDERTRLVVINSPHNPTGACVTAAELSALADALQHRGIPLLSDEVYWPLTYGSAPVSATRHPWPIVVGSASKSLSLSGLRTGWIIERDARRREAFLRTRMYFSISNSPLCEAIVAAALASSTAIVAPTRARAEKNRDRFAALVAAHGDAIGWVPPAGGTVAFPWLKASLDSAPFCEVLASLGVLVAPGACFGAPSHFRIGLAASADFDAGAAILERVASAAAPAR